jgi:Ca-activated chloride channel homolog
MCTERATRPAAEPRGLGPGGSGRLWRATMTACLGVLMCLVTQTALANPPGSSGFRVPSADVPSADVQFDASTQRVTITLPVEAADGNHFRDARPDNFVVYDNGVLQKNVTVQIQRSPVALGVLLEHGGRYLSLDEAIDAAEAAATEQLVNYVGPQDSVAVWTYGDRLVRVAGFQQGREGARRGLQSVDSSALSESNLYDALAGALGELRDLGGRKALLLISSGVDTFSKERYPDLLALVRDSGVPIYVIDLGAVLERDVSFNLRSSPYSRLDWAHSRSRLAEIAKVSGGHVYAPRSSLEFAAVYDDLMQTVHARYTISYPAPAVASSGGSRSVRVEVVDPRTGAPLMMADTEGRPVRPSIPLAGAYVPSSAAIHMS